jgi:hypothetical protein
MQQSESQPTPPKSNLICDSVKEGETSQVNNIDVSHGGTLLINTGEGKELGPLVVSGDGGNAASKANNGLRGVAATKDGQMKNGGRRRRRKEKRRNEKGKREK